MLILQKVNALHQRRHRRNRHKHRHKRKNDRHRLRWNRHCEWLFDRLKAAGVD
jgi:hypothetical protein